MSKFFSTSKTYIKITEMIDPWNSEKPDVGWYYTYSNTFCGCLIWLPFKPLQALKQNSDSGRTLLKISRAMLVMVSLINHISYSYSNHIPYTSQSDAWLSYAKKGELPKSIAVWTMGARRTRKAYKGIPTLLPNTVLLIYV